MFENIGHFFKRMVKTEQQKELGSKDAAKERLHLVLMQDRANVSADFLELMKQEIIDVIKKYIVVDEEAIDVRLTNQSNNDGTNGAPALYANIPIVNIKNDMMAEKIKDFEGVDFNKEMGIILEEEKAEIEEQLKQEEANEEVKEEQQPVIELPENNNAENIEKEDSANKEENKEEVKQENANNDEQDEEEVKELFEEVDEDDDDDVTFDDLLKAAEAAEAAEKEIKQEAEAQSQKEENENKEETENKEEKTNNENKDVKSTSPKTNSKSKSKSTKDKRKKK